MYEIRLLFLYITGMIYCVLLIYLHYIDSFQLIIINCIVYYRAGNDSDSSTLSSTSNLNLKVSRKIVGYHDDILDMVVIPKQKTDGVEVEFEVDRIALVSNSTQVRIVCTGDMTCESYDGHSDVILAVDVSPDGYVKLQYIFFLILCRKVTYLFPLHGRIYR